MNTLSERRQLLKAKRWATSQIRLHSPDFLSIDLKLRRDSNKASLWDNLPEYENTGRFEGILRVTDASEGFCISPALYCEDKKGRERVVLMRGYTYIGCAIEDDIITVKGDAIHDSNLIVVSHARKNTILPDFRNVPVN